VSDSKSWSVVSDGDWGGTEDGLGNSDLGDSWGGTVNDGVESVDGVSGVGNGTDGTIGLDKGVLSLDDISVTGFGGGLGVSGEGIRDGVSVVVLWMRVIWLWGNGDSLGNWLGIGDSLGNWLGIGDWGGTEDWGSDSVVDWGCVVDSWGSSISNWATPWVPKVE